MRVKSLTRVFAGCFTHSPAFDLISFHPHCDLRHVIYFTLHCARLSDFVSVTYRKIGENMLPVQARSQELEEGGSFSVSADRRIGLCDPIFPSGVWGHSKPPAGSGAEPRRQTHFDNNLVKIGLKSAL